MQLVRGTLMPAPDTDRPTPIPPPATSPHVSLAFASGFESVRAKSCEDTGRTLRGHCEDTARRQGGSRTQLGAKAGGTQLPAHQAHGRDEGNDVDKW